jgi:hypothetical protein
MALSPTANQQKGPLGVYLVEAHETESGGFVHKAEGYAEHSGCTEEFNCGVCGELPVGWEKNKYRDNLSEGSEKTGAAKIKKGHE